MIRDKYPKTRCDECGKETHVTDPKYVEEVDTDLPRETHAQVMNGMCLDLSGGYGMFTDTMFDHPGRARTVLCHDCFLKVARALPNLFPAGSGLHAQFHDEDDTSCCEYAWKMPGAKTLEEDDEIILVGDGRGGWVHAISRDDTI
jgi:hypothetical protein